MNEDNNNNLDSKIEKIRKISAILGIIGLFLILSVLLFDLSYPNILFSIILTLALALVFLSAGMYIATWVMDVHLAYKRKQFVLLAFLILGAIIYVLWQIYFSQKG